MKPVAGTPEKLLVLELPKALAKGLRYLADLDEKSPFGPLGGDAVKVRIEGDDVFALLQMVATRREAGALYEVHRDYWDIQYLVEGGEFIRTAALGGQAEFSPYDAGRDIAFYALAAGVDHLLTPGTALVIPPGVLHAPCLAPDAPGVVRKVVVKVAARLAPPPP